MGVGFHCCAPDLRGVVDRAPMTRTVIQPRLQGRNRKPQRKRTKRVRTGEDSAKRTLVGGAHRGIVGACWRSTGLCRGFRKRHKNTHPGHVRECRASELAALLSAAVITATGGGRPSITRRAAPCRSAFPPAGIGSLPWPPARRVHPARPPRGGRASDGYTQPRAASDTGGPSPITK